GSQVVYGDNMAADDVVAHEITHGVTEYTSNLIYYGQSGAINESFSDVWGEFIDQTNGSGTDSPSLKWLIGEDTALGVIRSMSNPPAYGDPDKMSSPYYYTGSDDNGGVHINSGVNNKAAYLMVEGGTFNGRTILAIGMDKTAAVYYEAQVNHLTMGANYNDLYYALLQACQNLTGVDGITENDCEQVRLAAEAVEMFSDITIPTAIPTFYPDTSTPTWTPFTPATPTKTKTPTPTFTFTPTKTRTPTGTATVTATATSQIPNIGVWIAGSQAGSHPLEQGQATRVSYPSINNGPVKIMSTNMHSLVGAESMIYRVNGLNTSFSEMMGMPASQLDTTYWLPWYNNVDLDTQLRFANVSNTVATVRVYIGGLEMDGSPFTLQPSESTRRSFAGVNNGPVQIVSNVSIVAAERIIYRVNGVNTSFSEMMALPASQLDTTYWLPWYNNVDLDTQLRFANVSNTVATVRVYVGGLEMDGSPFTLQPSESTRRSFAGVNNGPVEIVSTQPIVAAERVIYRVNGVNTSFSEMMALPNSQQDTTFWLPWYNNNDLDTQLRFANTTNTPATVHVYIGGLEMDGSPFTLQPSESTRRSFAGINSGPVKITSNVPIVAAERVIYKVNGVNTSFSEMMGLPNSQLNTTYWLPWYNNVDLLTQLRFGVP
ncbi:MAG TPA: M4 family metallopeptidase, partial [Anaerolineales bacterium]|nr:M4 family metallopeptidase [Anaerolineales bacterium]